MQNVVGNIKQSLLMFEGKTFSTPLLVQTDIHGGGHFFYVTHKKKLQFLENGYVELSYEVIDDHWASPCQYGNVLFSGTYNQPGRGHYSLDCELGDINETKMRIAGLFKTPDTLICSVFINGKDGYTTYLSELYFLEPIN